MSHGDDAGVEGARLSADEGLERTHQGRPRHEGVSGLLGHRPVTSLTPQHDVEAIHRCHHGPRGEADRAHGQAVPEVHSAHRVDAGQDPGRDHGLGPAATLLGRLKAEHELAREVSLGQALGRRQERRHVPVVAAGVHDPRGLAGVGVLARLLDRERVHVGPEEKRPPGTFRGEPRHDPSLGDPGLEGVAEGPEALADEARGPRLAVGQLGVGVEIPPSRDQASHLICAEGEKGWVTHGGSLGDQACAGSAAAGGGAPGASSAKKS